MAIPLALMTDHKGTAGIISGNDDGTLNPAGHAQRAHAAQMLMKFDKNVK